ncbi:hypothetical protein HT031_000001 [Scenedesmus sp. PABB004]|nr:hypothetical protein HT031_000001 [Scenedesmus sp. PABB004]
MQQRRGDDGGAAPSVLGQHDALDAALEAAEVVYVPPAPPAPASPAGGRASPQPRYGFRASYRPVGLHVRVPSPRHDAALCGGPPAALSAAASPASESAALVAARPGGGAAPWSPAWSGGAAAAALWVVAPESIIGEAVGAGGGGGAAGRDTTRRSILDVGSAPRTADPLFRAPAASSHPAGRRRRRRGGGGGGGGGGAAAAAAAAAAGGRALAAYCARLGRGGRPAVLAPGVRATDRVARYQALQQAWSRDRYLAASRGGRATRSGVSPPTRAQSRPGSKRSAQAAGQRAGRESPSLGRCRPPSAARATLSAEMEAITEGDRPLLSTSCGCPRRCHASCLARWQLQQAGKSEERYCRFCNGEYPDWKRALTPEALQPTTPVMAVSVRGRVHKLRVKPGPEGKEEFKRQVRALLGYDDTMDFDVIFECKTPHSGEKVQLHGFSAFDAATHCAAVSAARRKAPRQQQQQQQQQRQQQQPPPPPRQAGSGRSVTFAPDTLPPRTHSVDRATPAAPPSGLARSASASAAVGVRGSLVDARYADFLRRQHELCMAQYQQLRAAQAAQGAPPVGGWPGAPPPSSGGDAAQGELPNATRSISSASADASALLTAPASGAPAAAPRSPAGRSAGDAASCPLTGPGEHCRPHAVGSLAEAWANCSSLSEPLPALGAPAGARAGPRAGAGAASQAAGAEAARGGRGAPNLRRRLLPCLGAF